LAFNLQELVTNSEGFAMAIRIVPHVAPSDLAATDSGKNATNLLSMFDFPQELADAQSDGSGAIQDPQPAPVDGDAASASDSSASKNEQNLPVDPSLISPLAANIASIPVPIWLSQPLNPVPVWSTPQAQSSTSVVSALNPAVTNPSSLGLATLSAQAAGTEWSVAPGPSGQLHSKLPTPMSVSPELQTQQGVQVDAPTGSEAVVLSPSPGHQPPPTLTDQVIWPSSNPQDTLAGTIQPNAALAPDPRQEQQSVPVQNAPVIQVVRAAELGTISKTSANVSDGTQVLQSSQPWSGDASAWSTPPVLTAVSAPVAAAVEPVQTPQSADTPPGSAQPVPASPADSAESTDWAPPVAAAVSQPIQGADVKSSGQVKDAEMPRTAVSMQVEADESAQAPSKALQLEANRTPRDASVQHGVQNETPTSSTLDAASLSLPKAVGESLKSPAEHLAAAKTVQPSANDTDRVMTPHEMKSNLASLSPATPATTDGAVTPLRVEADPTQLKALGSQNESHKANKDLSLPIQNMPTASTALDAKPLNSEASLKLMPQQVRLDHPEVSSRIIQMAQSGGGEVRIDVTPPDESTFKISISVQSGQEAKLVVTGASDSTRTRLDQTTEQLRQQFAQMGLNLNLNFSQSSFNRSQWHEPGLSSSGSTDGPSSNVRANEAASLVASLPRTSSATGMVNLYA
jgi:hypothetical protein